MCPPSPPPSSIISLNKRAMEGQLKPLSELCMYTASKQTIRVRSFFSTLYERSSSTQQNEHPVEGDMPWAPV